MKTYTELVQNLHADYLSELQYEEQALAQMKVNLSRILHQTFDEKSLCVYVFDILAQKPEEYFLYIHPSVEQITGFSPAEVYQQGPSLIESRWKQEEIPQILEAHQVFMDKVFHMSLSEARHHRIITMNHFQHKQGHWIQLISTGNILRWHEKARPHLMLCTLRQGSVYTLDYFHDVENLLHEENNKVINASGDTYPQFLDGQYRRLLQSADQFDEQHLLDFLKRVAVRDLSIVLNDTCMLQFIRALNALDTGLTTMELKVCLLTVLGLNAMKKADILGISNRTVENHRNHIRKKLEIPRHISLAAFLLRYYPCEQQQK